MKVASLSWFGYDGVLWPPFKPRVLLQECRTTPQDPAPSWRRLFDVRPRDVLNDSNSYWRPSRLEWGKRWKVRSQVSIALGAGTKVLLFSLAHQSFRKYSLRRTERKPICLVEFHWHIECEYFPSELIGLCKTMFTRSYIHDMTRSPWTSFVISSSIETKCACNEIRDYLASTVNAQVRPLSTFVTRR